MEIHRLSYHFSHIFLLHYKIFMSKDQEVQAASFISGIIFIPKGLPFGSKWYAMKASTRG